MAAPFTLTVYDKAFRRLGWLGDAVEVTATPKHNGLGTLDVTLSAASAKLPLVTAEGVRIVCEYEGEHVVGGPVVAWKGKGPGATGEVTMTVADDFRLLSRVLGWPVPGQPLTGQGAAEYDTRTGPAETVLKGLVTANAVQRLGLPLTVAPDLGRGGTITVTSRFHPIADRVLPALEAAGLGVTIRQSGAGLVLDVYEPRVFPRKLTEASGVVRSWEWSSSAPEATRVIVGGQGEGTARTFAGFVDPDRETLWGDVAEVFRDARDSGSADVYTTRATETFAETAAKSGLKVELAETKGFRYGGPTGMHVGDRVTLAVGPSLEVTDLLRSASLKWTRKDGLVVSPTAGDVEDSTDAIFGRALRRTAAAIRSLRSA
jgi:hypothetical protein